jgi:hypothetical protein
MSYSPLAGSVAAVVGDVQIDPVVAVRAGRVGHVLSHISDVGIRYRGAAEQRLGDCVYIGRRYGMAQNRYV